MKYRSTCVFVFCFLFLQKGPKKNAMKESLMAVGFNFYLILARLIDVDPHMTDSKNCLSFLNSSMVVDKFY